MAVGSSPFSRAMRFLCNFLCRQRKLKRREKLFVVLRKALRFLYALPDDQNITQNKKPRRVIPLRGFAFTYQPFFFMKLSMGLPDKTEEVNIMKRFLMDQPFEKLEAVCSAKKVLEAREFAKNVYVHAVLLDYIAELIHATRNSKDIVAGVSPRGTLALVHAAQSYAWLQGRSYVVPEDIKTLAVPVLAHRLVLTRGYGSSITGEKEIENILSQVPVPTEEWEKR